MNKNILNEVLQGKTFEALEMDELRGIIDISFVDENGKETVVRITSKCGDPYLRLSGEYEAAEVRSSFTALSH